MALTASTMLPLGTRAPEFRLPDTVSGREVALADFVEKPVLVVMFICNHCPYVKHVRESLATFAREYQSKGVGIVAISSNDVTSHPDDSPDRMKAEAAEAGYSFPYLFDDSQEVARAYQAACTPDFYVFDRARKLVYRGQFDDSRPGSGRPVTGADLRAACDAALDGRELPSNQTASMGCNIKWKAGEEPDYFKS